MIELLLAISIVGLTVVSVYAYESYKWNGGVCIDTNKPWVLYNDLETGNLRWYTSSDDTHCYMTPVSFASLDGR